MPPFTSRPGLAGGTPCRRSAGGYAAIGALFNETVELIGRHADVSVIGDSANGVVTDDFLQRAKGRWGFDATLPAHVLSAVNQGADGLAVRVYSNQMQWHRGARFGRVQNAYDLVQARVLNIMQHPNKPGLWSDPRAVGAALAVQTYAADRRLAQRHMLPELQRAPHLPAARPIGIGPQAKGTGGSQRRTDRRAPELRT